MVPRAGIRPTVAGGTAALLACALLAACGSTQVRASDPPAAPGSCPGTVLQTLASVVRRIYREGVHSERTIVAEQFITRSRALRSAVEADDPAMVRAAARALVAHGKLTDLRVVREGHLLAAVGPPAVAPLTGTLSDAAGIPIATFVTSVWTHGGFLTESDAIAEGFVALRAHNRNLAGSHLLPPGRIPAEGSITVAGTPYQYASFGGTAYPAGALRIYLLRSVPSLRSLCGETSEDTTVNTLAKIATLIYHAEGGRRTRRQVLRVQRNAPLLRAVADREPVAARAAIVTLLNEHIVRLRVSASGGLLADVGGPYVLAPVSAPLLLHGRRIGSFVLSIQDDEGYLRLTRRLVGLKVLMYMGSQLVKDSLGPEPGRVPASGRYSYHGETYRVVTLNAEAFPSGPLTIRVLVPIPYV